MKKKVKKVSKFKEVEEKFKQDQQEWKARIKLEPNKFKRFWKWVWYLIAFPWKWIWVNIRDWHTFLIFIITVLVVSSEVWVPYLIGFICWNNEPLRISMMSVGSACWLFWAGPGTPFLVICIVITIGVKGLFNKLKEKKHGLKELDKQ